MAKGPQFLEYANPILDILKSLGDSGTPTEVTDLVIEKLNVSEEEQNITNKNGQSRIKNRIAWARFYLAKGGFLDSSIKGVWSLTDKGKNSELSHEDIFAMFKVEHSKFKAKKSKTEESDDDQDIDVVEGRDYRDELLDTLKSLSPEGFERICQRLLRESGFNKVVVTGRVGDGGIDGNGILQVNPLVSFKVLFQCKRYQGSVGSSQVRDFRGAMQGRADKGIFLTTGTFTTESKKEAQRDGVPPIELVDGDKLVEMFEMLELGLKPKKVYDIDMKFFDEFK